MFTCIYFKCGLSKIESHVLPHQSLTAVKLAGEVKLIANLDAISFSDFFQLLACFEYNNLCFEAVYCEVVLLHSILQ